MYSFSEKIKKKKRNFSFVILQHAFLCKREELWLIIAIHSRSFSLTSVDTKPKISVTEPFLHVSTSIHPLPPQKPREAWTGIMFSIANNAKRIKGWAFSLNKKNFAFCVLSKNRGWRNAVKMCVDWLVEQRRPMEKRGKEVVYVWEAFTK